jgi:hypothetical protein
MKESIMVYTRELLEPRIRCADPDCKHDDRCKDPRKRSWFEDGLFVLIAHKNGDGFSLWRTDSKDIDGNSNPHLRGRLTHPAGGVPVSLPGSEVSESSVSGHAGQIKNKANSSEVIAGAETKVKDSAVQKPKVAAPAIIVSGVIYRMYLILHPETAFAYECLEKINKDGPAEFGVPHEIEAKPERISIGNQILTRAVLNVPTLEKGYYPKGHENYEGLVLYEYMPHRGCQKAKRAISKLQVHLGVLRYPIGNQENPYWPADVYDKTKGIIQLTAGRFDSLTYNAVLAFIRDAKAGKAEKLSQNHYGSIISKEEKFAYKHVQENPDKPDPNVLIEFKSKEYTEKYRNSSPETPPKLNYDDQKPDKRDQKDKLPLVMVDQIVGKTIQEWLKEGFRKPGHILVSRSTNHGGRKHHAWMTWYRDDFALKMDDWDKYVKQLGVNHGIVDGSSFRDIRTDVGGGVEGMIAKSLHKTGIAADLDQADYKSNTPDFPIYYQWEHTPTGNIAWRLFGESSLTNSKARERLNELALIEKYRDSAEEKHRLGIWPYKIEMYLDVERSVDEEKFFQAKIREWLYDPTDPLGGRPGDWKTQIDGQPYVDLTRIAQSIGVERINAYKEGWYLGKTVKLNGTFKGFQNLIKVVDQIEADDLSEHFARIDLPEAKSYKIARDLKSEGRQAKILKKPLSPAPVCKFCGNSLRVGDEYYQTKSPPMLIHKNCVDILANSRDTGTYVLKVSEMNPPFLKAWGEKMPSGEPRLFPTPDLRISLPQIFGMCSKIEPDETLAQGIFLICFESSDGIGELTKVPGSQILNHFKSNSNWRISVLPFWTGMINKKRIPHGPSEKQLLAGWIERMESEGLKVSIPWDGTINLETSELDRFADVVEEHFQNNLQCKIIDKYGKSKGQGGYVIRGKRFREDFFRKVDGWKMHIRPHLSDNFILKSGTSLFMPRKGEPRCMEWWHFQYDLAAYREVQNDWEQLMYQIGWTKEGLQKVGYKV